MTGYAAGTADFERGRASIELRSVNSRYLDLQLRIAEEVRTAEPALREMIGARVSRGKVECRIAFNAHPGASASGSLDVAALQLAVDDVVARHEVLRTVYPEIDGTGVQDVLSPERARLTPAVENVSETAVLERVAELVTAGFDVTTAVPVRAALLRIAEDDHVFVFVAHHIAADGFSIAPLTRDVVTAYAARVQGGTPTWAPLPVQYADYTLWQRDVLGDEADPQSLLAQQLGYWTEVLAGAPEEVTLPTDRPRPAALSHRGATHRFTVPADVRAGIDRLAERTGLHRAEVAGLVADLRPHRVRALVRVAAEREVREEHDLPLARVLLPRAPVAAAPRPEQRRAPDAAP